MLFVSPSQIRKPGVGRRQVVMLAHFDKSHPRALAAQRNDLTVLAELAVLKIWIKNLW
jgi:hypothetical protein